MPAPRRLLVMDYSTERKLGAMPSREGERTVSASPFRARRYFLGVEVQRKYAFKGYPGAAIRGMMVNAVRQRVCRTGAPVCEGCAHIQDCPFAQVIKPPPQLLAADRPSVFAPPPRYALEAGDVLRQNYSPGKAFEFAVVLLNRGIDFEDAVLEGLADAWRTWGQMSVIKTDNFVVQSPPHSQSGVARNVRVLLRTPLQLRNEARLAATGFDDRHLFRVLLRRINWLARQDRIALPSRVKLTTEPHWRLTRLRLDWTRQRSIGPKKTVDLSGWTGHIDMTVAPSEYVLLDMARWTHAGSHATYGLGQIDLQLAPSNY